jgi:MFS family permease
MGIKLATDNKWYVLGLTTCTLMFVVSMPEMCMAVLFKEISVDLNMNLVQIGMVWGIVPFSSLFVLFLGGALSDKYGVKRTLVLTCFFSGLFGALRGISWDFASLLVIVFLLGFFTSIANIACMKAAATWFSGKRLGVANGVLSTGMGVGFTVSSMISATVLSPWLGGWRNVLFMYGTITIIIALLWVFTIKGSGKAGPSKIEETISFRHSISHVLHIKSVWFLGLTLFGMVGSIRGLTGYLSLYLQGSGWAAANADGTVAAFCGISAAGAIPITMLSARIGSRKKIVLPYITMVIIGIASLSLVNNAFVWLIVLFIGAGRDGFMALCMTMLTETEGIGPEYSGTALGLMQNIGRVGPMISPALGNSLATISPGLPFVLWSMFAMVSFISSFFIRRKKSVAISIR